MAERSVALTTVKGGINRLRVKGAALNDSLYDLLNGYVTAARTIKVRPGTFRHAELPVDTFGQGETKGLVSFDGSLHLFATEPMDVPDGFTLHVVRHPLALSSAASDVPIKKIHFAAPFMGFLYAVIEFDGDALDTESDIGNVFHYWLQTGEAWEPNKAYSLGAIVTPTVPNGFAYQAKRLTAPFPSWAPGVIRQGPTDADVIEPTVYNDFFYTVVETLGTNPRSGDVEPDWPEEDGAQISEEADGQITPDPVATETPVVTQTPNPDTLDRYLRILDRAF